MMHGGMVVVGLITGGHFLEDIQVAVPHKVAVFIPADKMLRSKDLYRALNQNLLFKLDGGTAFTSEPETPMPNEDTIRIARLEAENRLLTQQLQATKAQNDALQLILGGFQQQFTALQDGIVRLEQRPAVVNVSNHTSGPSVPAPVVSDVVGGDAPAFMPETIAPKDVEGEIRVEKQVSDSSTVGAAGNKLRELRRGNKAAG